MATHSYLARWVWNATELRWEPPLIAQCTGALDLRARASMGTAGGTGGFGLFAYPTTVTISGSTYLGVDFANLNNTRRNALNNNLGVALTTNESLDRVINKLLLQNGSPDGSAKWRPLMIGKNRQVDIRFAGLSIGIGFVQDDEIGFLASLDARKADYTRMRNAGVSLANLRKWNGYDLINLWGSRDSNKLSLIVPAEFINDGSDPPETTVSDDFNRADGGLGGNWTVVLGTWSILTNRARTTTATFLNYARYSATALSSDDHYAEVQAKVWGTNGTLGAACRCSTDASPNHDYYYHRSSASGTNAADFGKFVNGTNTSLGTWTPSIAADDELRIQANDSTITAFHNLTQMATATDTAITGNLYAGMVTRRSGDIQDNFLAADLVLPNTTRMIFAAG